MKNKLLFLLIILFISSFAFAVKPSYSRINKVLWHSDNPFRTDVFVENKGQFDKLSGTKETVRYAVNNSDKIYFTDNGLTIKLEKLVSLREEELANEGKEEEEEFETETYYVHMKWLGANAGVSPQVSEQTEGYYTFGEKAYVNIKAKGYKKLLYKNLYNGIDVEYSIHSKGGIKYRLILHQGADISRVQMAYSGDVSKLNIDAEGNINVITKLGNIIDHAPLNNFILSNNALQNNLNLPVSFILKNKSVSFSIPETYKSLLKSNTQIVIDPWTITPYSMSTSNIAYDTDFDDNGNVYISGGTSPFKLSKYSSNGTFVWTYTLTGWSYSSSLGVFSYSRFCVIPNTGTIFIGEGVNTSVGPRVMKLSTNGTLQKISNNFAGNQEIWVMFYNRCTGRLNGFGGGTQNSNNLQMIADTNLTSSTIKNFNGSSQVRNDVASVVQDFNGDFYALITSQLTSHVYRNHIMKSLSSNNYNPPCIFDVISNYDFNETNNSGIPNFTPYNITVRANALALNGAYLYSYDGRTLYVRNSTSGTVITSLTVNQNYYGGQNRSHEGIGVDECNNIYVGGSNMVHVYSFNGTQLTTLTPITANITGEVFDVRVDKLSNLVYACGNGFLTVIQGQACTVHQFQVVPTVDTCNLTAVINVTGGTEPYTFHWSNGSTSNTISGVPPGFYTVTVSDNSCNSKKSIDTIQIKSKLVINITGSPHICPGSSAQLTASGAKTYVWSPNTGLNTTSGSIVIASPVTNVTYTVSGTDSDNCHSSKTFTLGVSSPNLVMTPASKVLCKGDFVALKAEGSNSYKWSPASGLNITTGANVNANPIASTTYTITGTDSYGCTSMGTVAVTVNNLNITLNPESASICKGSSVTINASGGSNYKWSPASSLNVSTGSVVSASPQVNTTYTVSATDANNCSGTKTVNVSIYASTLTVDPPSPSTCQGSKVTITASGMSNYIWSPATGLNTTTGATVIATPTVSSTYTVSGTDSHNCNLTLSVLVSIYILKLTVIPQTPTVCEGKSVTLNVSGAKYYKWSPTTGMSPATGSIVIATPTSNITYTVTGTDDNGCTSTGTVSVTVNRFGLVLDPVTATICKGNSVNLSASGAGNYKWSPSDGLNTTIGNIVVASPQLNTTYTVSATDNNGCSGIKTVAVSLYESKLAIDPPTASICPGASVTFNASGLSNYAWSPGTGLNTTLGSSVTASPSVNTTYTVSGTDEHSCKFSKSVPVLIDTAKLRASPDSAKVCAGSTVILKANGGEDYKWSPAASLNTTIGESVTASPTVNTTYTVSTIGCSLSTILKDSIAVVVLPLPVFSFGKDITVEEGKDTLITPGDNFTSYLWQDGSSGQTFTVNKKGKYWVIVEDKNGCKFSDTVEVKFDCRAKFPDVPNVFTPFNGDDMNDIFIFSTRYQRSQEYIKLVNCIKDFNMKIYNRWGVKIFESNDVIQGWNGQNNGKDVSEAVYFYVLTYILTEGSDSVHHSKSGSVTLMK